MVISSTQTGLFLNQRKYIFDVLSFAPSSFSHKCHNSSLPSSYKSAFHDSPPFSQPSLYRKFIRKLLYQSLTRLDIFFSVHFLSQFVSSPTTAHYTLLLQLLHYLHGTISFGLFYPKQNNLTLYGFSDADWGSCLHTRKSISGFCIFLGHSLIFWKSKKQPMVSKSSTESEYRCMAATTSELLWLSYLLQDLKVPIFLPITLFCDNKSAQLLAANPCLLDHSKHFAIDFHFTREKVQQGFLQTVYIPSRSHPADLFTKPLVPPQHSSLSSKLGLVQLEGGL